MLKPALEVAGVLTGFDNFGAANTQYQRIDAEVLG